MHQDDETLRTSWTLVARLKNVGDQEGWREFYQLYRRVVLGVAVKAGLRQHEAEEVLQETMASVSKNIQEFIADPAHGSFRAWLLQMVRWRIIDQMRKRMPVGESANRHPEEATGTSTLGRIPDERIAQLEAVCDSEWRKNLMAEALQKLQLEVKAEHYQVLHLVAVEERSVRETAKMVGRSAAQIYVIKFRLTRRLKSIMADLQEKLG